MENHLHQDIAEFIAQPIRLTAPDGVDHFVGFFEQVLPQTAVRLFPIPGQPDRGAARPSGLKARLWQSVPS
jgi:hypothetical protein